MDWIHCNNCFFLPGMGKRFFLTSCGHIYCADCIKGCASDHCKLCGNTCSSIPLSSEMKPEVEMFFSDPLELLKKYLKEIQKVAEFQNSHRTRLFAHQREMAKKIPLVRDEFKKLQLKFKECESEKQKLQNQVSCMKQMLNISHSEIPTPMPSDTYDQTPQYLQKVSGDAYRDITPLSKWSQASSSHSRHRSGGSTASLSSSSYPAMPARMTVRTPPVDGKIGVIPGTPLSSGRVNFQQLRLSSQRGDPDATPKVIKGAFVSPMSISPCSSVTSVISQDYPRAASNCRSVSHCNPKSSCSGDGNTASGSQSSGIRQIMLPHNLKNAYGSIKTLAVSPYSPSVEKAKRT